MTTFPEVDYEPAFADAIRLFWATRDGQAESQRARGVSDQGTRGSVTAGKHLNALAALVARVFEDAGLPPRKELRSLPGYYRGAKNWDGVITYEGQLVAIVELKSQAGSFGKNQNNRIEEMVGQGRDIDRAAEHGLLGRLRPWFGYVMVLEDAPGASVGYSTRTHPNYPPDVAFKHASNVERYRLALDRMRLQGELNAACFVTTQPSSHEYRYPDSTMTFKAFAASIQARVHEVIKTIG